MVRFINLTPHEVTVYSEDGKEVVLRIPPSGTIARVSTTSKIIKKVDGVLIRKTEYNKIEGLPEPQEDTIYIVSTVLLIALKEKGIMRDDVIAPDTNPDSVIRDSQGRVIGVKYFQTL